MMKWITYTTAALALIGAIITGLIEFDTTYARAADVEKKVDGMKEIYLKSEQRNVSKQQFDLAVTKQERRLTPIEAQRANQLNEDKADIDAQLKTLQQKKSSGGSP